MDEATTIKNKWEEGSRFYENDCKGREVTSLRWLARKKLVKAFGGSYDFV